MPKRFEAYRMRDGETPLSQDYFNPIFGDIDARIAELEERRADMQGVVDELTKFGLARIDTLVVPVMDEVDAMLQQMRGRRDELEEAIEKVGELATVTQLNEAMDAQAVDRDKAIKDAVGAEASARADALMAEGEARNAAIAMATAKAGAATYTYNADGRVSEIVETVLEGERATTLVYDASGRVATTAETIAGRTRNINYAYDGTGRMSGFEAVEV